MTSTYNLTDKQKQLLTRWGWLLVDRSKGKKPVWPHHILLLNYMKRSLCRDQFGKYKEGYRFVSEQQFGFSVGKYSYGFQQFWGEPNNSGRLLKSVGAFCSIARNVTIPAGNHPMDSISSGGFLYSKDFGFVAQSVSNSDSLGDQSVVIGNDVWIGTNAIVMPSVTIGNGAVIGAGSIVTRDVPAYAIVAGVPAKVIRYRFDAETVALLEQSCWWQWDDDLIKQHIDELRDQQRFVPWLKKELGIE
ncbi:MAG: CatB-related O-acetyltransferase [Halopseudomonas sp.]